MTEAEQPVDLMTQRDVAALAALVHGRRPDWDEPGIAAAIRQVAATVPAGDVVIAMIRAARDPSNETPAAALYFGNRAWDDDGYPPCPVHPNYRARRADGECGACYADRVGRPGEPRFVRQRPPAEAAEQINDALHRGHREAS